MYLLKDWPSNRIIAYWRQNTLNDRLQDCISSCDNNISFAKGKQMFKRYVIVLLILLVLVVSFPLVAQDEAPVFYWISHGAPADPVWTYFLQGAEQWAA